MRAQEADPDEVTTTTTSATRMAEEEIRGGATVSRKLSWSSACLRSSIRGGGRGGRSGCQYASVRLNIDTETAARERNLRDQ